MRRDGLCRFRRRHCRSGICALLRIKRARRGAAKAHLVFFGAGRNAGVVFFDDEATELFPSACAKVMNMSAKAAFVIHIFSPFMIQCVPSGLRTAFVFAASASEPLLDSESA